MSYSETLRIASCMQILSNINTVLPETSDPQNITKRFQNIIKDRNRDKYNSEDIHKFLSDLYFETRKAIECWDKFNASSSSKK